MGTLILACVEYRSRRFAVLRLVCWFSTAPVQSGILGLDYAVDER